MENKTIKEMSYSEANRYFKDCLNGDAELPDNTNDLCLVLMNIIIFQDLQLQAYKDSHALQRAAMNGELH